MFWCRTVWSGGAEVLRGHDNIHARPFLHIYFKSYLSSKEKKICMDYLFMFCSYSSVLTALLFTMKTSVVGCCCCEHAGSQHATAIAKDQ